MLLQGDGREELPRPPWDQGRNARRHMHLGVNLAMWVARTCVHSFSKQGFKRHLCWRLAAGATVGLPVPVRDVLTQHRHLVHPYPSQTRPPHFVWVQLEVTQVSRTSLLVSTWPFQKSQEAILWHWRKKWKCQLLGRVQLFVTPIDCTAPQAPLSMKFSRQ